MKALPLLRIADPAARCAGWRARLGEFLAAGRHGDMDWMAETAERRADPLASVAASALRHHAGHELCAGDRSAGSGSRRKDTGVISVYALGRDYHDVIKGKLKHLAQWLARETRAEVKVFVDTAPLMEKPLAPRPRASAGRASTPISSRASSARGSFSARS